jgi:hypothetical protein
MTTNAYSFTEDPKCGYDQKITLIDLPSFA